MIKKDDIEALRKKFGDQFISYLKVQEYTANFFVAWDGMKGKHQAEWAFLICMGYAFTHGQMRG